MPRRAFIADLDRLCALEAFGDHVKKVKRGEDDGTFAFTFAPPSLGGNGIEITGMIPELADYPDSHQTFIYVSSDNSPTYLSSALDKLNLGGKNLRSTIEVIAEELNRVVENLHSENVIIIDGEDDQSEYEEEEDDCDDDGSYGGWSDDELELPGDSQSTITTVDNTTSQVARKAIRNDLRLVRDAGFKYGVLGDYNGGVDLYVSVSVRISKLGISDEALSAWKLNPTKYLVILIHYSQRYQDFDKLTSDGTSYHTRKHVEIYVGTHSHYKPTLTQAITAFSKISNINEAQSQLVAGEDGLEEVQEDKPQQDGFQALFISRPLNELINSRLIQILMYRKKYGFSWDGAERFCHNNLGRNPSDLEHIDDRYYSTDAPKYPLAPLVMGDALTSPAGDRNSIPPFPLLAMQFTLRHLVRCTEFCLVCHTKVSTDFEALKPYVCSNPLCLYQYMSLGFGPSIEHEIISQPSVVDLLVSFCYASARAGKLADFPDGMNLMVPMSAPWKAKYHRHRQEIYLGDENDTRCLVKLGQFISITLDGHASDEWHARVVETAYYPTIRISPPFIAKAVADTPNPPPHAPSSTSDTTGGQATPEPIRQEPAIPGTKDICPINFRIYDTNFDELAAQDKRSALINLMNTLPPINEMKTWLEKNTKLGEGASLKQWKSRLNSSSLGMLRWIIASNRSCIVALQDEKSSTGNRQNFAGEQKVYGMDGWTQFRFAMGAPDKEQRFVNSVRGAQLRLSLMYPSLFAFHGSPLANWHSIIREGLHFKVTANGRAYGNGCYHSLDLNTSLGYSNSYYSGYNNPNSGGMQWPQSDLKIASALCLNEIVNAPNEFVSKTPHLVVAQLDWIQTRYLFVQTAKDATATGTVGAKETVAMPNIHPQDPSFTPRGNRGALVIPYTGRDYPKYTDRGSDCEILDTPPPNAKGRPKQKGRRSKQTPSLVGKMGTTGTKQKPIEIDIADDATVGTDEEDLTALLSDVDEAPTSAPVPKDKGKAVKKSNRPDAFIPGSLDYVGITFLPPPAYASHSATKRLQQELRTVIKLQEAQSLEELGFYVSPDKVENVYQWIVELHSFPENLPIVKDMRSKSPVLRSIVLEMRFGPQYPMSPPFIRVVKPRFLGFGQGGGGHITIGGALCMELLTNTGWSAVSSIESVLLQVRMAIGEEKPAARLEPGPVKSYGVDEAREAFVRACRNHGWEVPSDFQSIMGRSY